MTGATGPSGASCARAPTQGAQITVLSRDPARASDARRTDAGQPIELARWDPLGEPAPADALSGRDAVVHLAGEPIAQRWSERAKRAIRDSRVQGTRQLVAGIAAADPRPHALISGSAVGYYGNHAARSRSTRAPRPATTSSPGCASRGRPRPSARPSWGCASCVAHRRRARPRGGALAKMLPPFRLGVGGPVAGGRQYIPWIHVDDLIGMMLAALRRELERPDQRHRAQPVSNRDFSQALGPRAAAPGRHAGARARPARCSTARWPRS